jgi:hypothetical protein
MLWTTATRLKVESNPHEKRKSVEAELSVVVFNGSKPNDLVFLLFLHLNLKHSSATRTSASICSYPRALKQIHASSSKAYKSGAIFMIYKEKGKEKHTFCCFQKRNCAGVMSATTPAVAGWRRHTSPDISGRRR